MTFVAWMGYPGHPSRGAVLHHVHHVYSGKVRLHKRWDARKLDIQGQGVSSSRCLFCRSVLREMNCGATLHNQAGRSTSEGGREGGPWEV